LSKRTAKPTTANKNTRERIMIKMKYGLLIIGIIILGLLAMAIPMLKK
jgi:hypothetical protein